MLRGRLEGGVVLDLGPGNGVTSFALARAGARRTYVVEAKAFSGAMIDQIACETPGEIEPLEGVVGEAIDLPDESVDAVYSRSAMHQLDDLVAAAREIRRVLRPSGIYLACREHVVEGIPRSRASWEPIQLIGLQAGGPRTRSRPTWRRYGGRPAGAPDVEALRHRDQCLPGSAQRRAAARAAGPDARPEDGGPPPARRRALADGGGGRFAGVSSKRLRRARRGRSSPGEGARKTPRRAATLRTPDARSAHRSSRPWRRRVDG